MKERLEQTGWDLQSPGACVHCAPRATYSSRTACCSVMPATTDACTTSGPCPTCYVEDCSRPALTRQPGYLQMCPRKLQFFHFLRLCGARHADASSCCCRVVVRGKLQLSCQHLQWLLGHPARELLLWLPTGPRSPGASSLFPGHSKQ